MTGQMVEFLVQGLVIGLTAGISPGPLLMLFLAKAMQDGWRKTLPAAFAPLLSDGPIILLTVVVLTRLPDTFLDALRIVGAFLLLYLAWKAVRSANAAAAFTVDARVSLLSTVRSAALVNLFNPNPYIFWSTILGPTLVLGWRQAPQIGLAFAAGFYGALIGVFAAWIIIVGVVGSIRPEARRFLTIISGIGMAGFGLFQLAAGLDSLYR